MEKTHFANSDFGRAHFGCWAKEAGHAESFDLDCGKKVLKLFNELLKETALEDCQYLQYVKGGDGGEDREFVSCGDGGEDREHLQARTPAGLGLVNQRRV